MNTLSKDLPLLVIVGFIWGVTNPLMRRGVVKSSLKSSDQEPSNPTTVKIGVKWLDSLLNFRKLSVLLPYGLNQCGSVIFYRLLAISDLTLAVPICNALALTFGSIMAWILGERVDNPFRAIFGCIMITLGVCICMAS